MRIAVAVDLSPFSRVVVDQAEAIATASSASMVLVHVAAPDPEFVGYDTGPQHERDHRAGQLHSEHEELQRMAAELRERGLDAKALLVQGPTVETLLSVAKESDADLIIVGSHGRSALARVWLGSVSTEIVNRSTVPVLIVPMAGRGGD